MIFSDLVTYHIEYLVALCVIIPIYSDLKKFLGLAVPEQYCPTSISKPLH